MSASMARLKKVLSTPKKTSARGVSLLRMALFSAEPVSPDLRNSILALLASSKTAITSSLTSKLS